MDTPQATEARAVIERHGGTAAVSRMTGYSIGRINNWKERGIPAAARVAFPALFWPELAERADAPPAHHT